MNDRQKEFLGKMAKLCEEFQPDFFYTVDDDGIHIVVDGLEVFVGYSLTAKNLLKAID